MGFSGGNLKTTLKVKIYDTDLYYYLMLGLLLKCYRFILLLKCTKLIAIPTNFNQNTLIKYRQIYW